MWSKKYDKCIICGETDKKHVGKGMCKNCYNKEWSRKNFNKVKKYDRKRYKENFKKRREYAKKWRRKNPEYGMNYYKENSEKISERNKENSEKRKEYRKKKFEQNPNKVRKKDKEKRRKWREKNPEKAKYQTKIASRKWRKNHPEYIKNRLFNIQYKIKCNASALINIRLKKRLSSKKGKSTWDFLPYTVEELMLHLESLFIEGMTWNNHGIYGWHIDHIIPDCKFNYKNVEDEEFQECWALSNLQPLWAEDNLRKSGR